MKCVDPIQSVHDYIGVMIGTLNKSTFFNRKGNFFSNDDRALNSYCFIVCAWKSHSRANVNEVFTQIFCIKMYRHFSKVRIWIILVSLRKLVREQWPRIPFSIRFNMYVCVLIQLFRGIVSETRVQKKQQLVRNHRFQDDGICLRTNILQNYLRFCLNYL